MKTIFNLFIVRKTLACLLATAALLAWCSTASAFQNPIFFEGFDGPGDPLTFTTEELADETWVANGFATDNKQCSRMGGYWIFGKSIGYD